MEGAMAELRFWRSHLQWGNDDKFALGKMSDLNARDGAGDMVGRGKWCMGK